eukprot:g13361.t1
MAQMEAAQAKQPALQADSPYESREKGKDKLFDAYWRLDCPTSGTTVEAFWPDFSCWLPVKFLRVSRPMFVIQVPSCNEPRNPDGSFCIMWKSDNSTSVLPNDHVRKLGDTSTPEPVKKIDTGLSNLSKQSQLLMRLLRMHGCRHRFEKLKSIDIVEVDALMSAVEAELRGRPEGVNQRLQRAGQRSFADATLTALQSTQRQLKERETAENQPPPEARSDPRPSSGAFSRQALKPQQVFSYESLEEPVAEPKKEPLPETLPGAAGALPAREGPEPSGLKPGFLLDATNSTEGPAGPAPTGPMAPSEERPKFTWKRDGHEEESRSEDGPRSAGREDGGVMIPAEEEEEEEAIVYCPRQHPLRLEGAPYEMDCDRCSKEMLAGQEVWWCGLCGYNLCNECHAEQQ